MPSQPSLSTELTREEKLRIARGELPVEDAGSLDVLIALASDPDPEVRGVAGQTLTTLGDERFAELLANPLFSAPAARYLLDPGHLRPALLPKLLAHPATPDDAVSELAAKG
jgi:hypothetical protein